VVNPLGIVSVPGKLAAALRVLPDVLGRFVSARLTG
jgi:hypothetical protein